MDQDEKYNLIAKIARSFSPSAPIDRKALFAGRASQITEAINAFHQRGQHAVIFGERGVGKTSLAKVLVEIQESSYAAVRNNEWLEVGFYYRGASQHVDNAASCLIAGHNGVRLAGRHCAAMGCRQPAD